MVPCHVLAVCGYTACTIDYSRGFWYGTLPCHIMFENTKLLAASTSAVEWYKSRAHTSFLSEVIQILNVTSPMPIPCSCLKLFKFCQLDVNEV